MQINRSTDDAVRIILHLSLANPLLPVPLADIAAGQKLSLADVQKVMPTLVQAGYVEVLPGPHGGARLLRAADKITILDIVEKMEGPLALNRCVLHPEECPREPTCPVHELWVLTTDDVARRLRSLRVSTLAARYKKSSDR